MRGEEVRTGVTFGVLSSSGADRILLDLTTFRASLELSMCLEEARALRDALIEECGEKGAARMSQYVCNKIINVRGLCLGSGIVEVKIADGDTERTFHIDGHDAAMIGEYGQSVLLNAHEKFEKSTTPVLACQDWDGSVPRRFSFCPECGEALK